MENVCYEAIKLRGSRKNYSSWNCTTYVGNDKCCGFNRQASKNLKPGYANQHNASPVGSEGLSITNVGEDWHPE